MKTFYTLIAILLFTLSSKAQDLIVTSKGDSIKCNIIKTTAQDIQFWARNKHELKKHKLLLSEVKLYERGFYTPKNISDSIAKVKPRYSKFTIAPYGGLSYLIGKTSSEIPSSARQHIRELRSGFHIGADALVFVSPRTGLGLKYTNFKTAAKSGIMSDDVSVNFIAPVLASKRISTSQKTVFNSNISIGYLNYRNEAFAGERFILTGKTVGLAYGLGIDNMLSKNFGLGLKLDLVVGSIGEFQKTNGISTQTIERKGNQRENISRIDFSIAFKLDQ